ncbi:ribosome-binding factor A [Bifidobacterium actinocoloniiforme DSM 22766]|uniref:Ribosome-binding factor A n=1 Tax=Bifidobacterium actinocoloniiforme DSM 22766 TaxID=1437605 RepID=A0A086YYT3_9BIFI|nr:30S ribosome-binding factor RbfA [Bifidobacterium actinocoloniiforme]AKV55951.1 ribosome-binding factor A [Bifidobacterium actinocoloniiforme DSM 22766]KFI39433.1 ribosome-binding factor A [Bifidobacterium actinocoloniiforme DSM 22766]
MASGSNPRAVRIAALIQRVIASSLESKMHDKRLDGVTITEVRVTNDLQIAKVYWTQIGKPGHEQGERKRAQQALRQATGRLRSLVGAKAGLRLTPTLRFIYDEVPSQATEIEDALTIAQKRDQELQAARADAEYAGDPDPYKHDDEEDEAGDDPDRTADDDEGHDQAGWSDLDPEFGHAQEVED